MNPILFEIGPLTLRTYSAWLIAGIAAGLALIAASAWRHDRRAVGAWLDVALAGLIAGVIGARALHVALEWDYFAGHTDEIARLALGGMAWHGGVVAGALGVWGAARIRRVPLRAWTDALALAWPPGMAGAWLGCRAAGCGYGYEVATLADWPGWLVEELPDVFGLYAPRLDVAAFGALWAVALFALALTLTGLGWLRGLRLWVILALGSLGLALLAFFRMDPAPQLMDRRADQVYDLVVLGISTAIGGALWLGDRRAQREDQEQLTTENAESTAEEPESAEET